MSIAVPSASSSTTVRESSELPGIEAASSGYSSYPSSRSPSERLRYLAQFMAYAPNFGEASAAFAAVVRNESLEVTASGDSTRNRTMALGAALHHVRVAAEAFGEEIAVEEFPAGPDATLVARLTIVGRLSASAHAQRMLVAAARRRETPHAFRPSIVAAASVKAFANECRRERVAMRVIVGDERDAFSRVVDSLDSRSAPGPSAGSLRGAALLDGSPLLLTVMTGGDSRSDWLAAGQAVSGLWLRATDLGLAVSLIDRPIADADARQAIRGIVRSERAPQMVLRVGPYDGPSVPAPPRISLGEVFADASVGFGHGPERARMDGPTPAPKMRSHAAHLH